LTLIATLEGDKLSNYGLMTITLVTIIIALSLLENREPNSSVWTRDGHRI